MTNNISSRDWEALSAYLDGYLSQKERQRLEDRLQHSMELKNGLEELRRTRLLLRNQPKMRAPRNFTLTPEMVGGRASRRSVPQFFPVMRLASVLASILLVLVVVGDLLTVTNTQTAQLDIANRVMEQEAPMVPEAAELEMPAAASEVQTYSEKALELEATAPAGLMMAAPTEGVQGTPAEPSAAMTSPSGGGVSPPGEQVADSTALSAPVETPTLAIELLPAPIETPAPAAPLGRPYWRAVEILLALIAVTSGLIAWYMHRSSGG